MMPELNTTGMDESREKVEKVVLSTPPATPGRVFSPTSPVPRESPTLNDSFRIRLSTEVFRAAAQEKRKRQMKFVLLVVIILSALFLTGLVYFDPISKRYERHGSLSQMVVVVGCVGLLIVCLMGWLLWKWVSRSAKVQMGPGWQRGKKGLYTNME